MQHACQEHAEESLFSIYPVGGPNPTLFDPSGTSSSAPSCQADDIAQGAHPDCFFVASCIALVHTSPSTVISLFDNPSITIAVEDSCSEATSAVTTTESSLGVGGVCREDLDEVDRSQSNRQQLFTVRFWSGKSWRRVPVEAKAVVVSNRGGAEASTAAPLFVRSPTRKWWPLVLERAYASHYGHYDAISGGNIAEVLRDLTSQPVASHALPFGKDDEAKWIELGKRLKSKACCAVVGTHQAFKRDIGLQLRHAYAVLGVLSPQETNHKDLLIILRNPNPNQVYTGPPKVTPALSAAMATLFAQGQSLPPGVLALPLPLVNEFLNTLYICELAFPTPTSMDLVWPKKGGSGGCLSHRSFSDNPAFAIIGTSGVRDTVWLTLSHADQRGHDASGGAKKISYEPCGFTVLVQKSMSEESKGGNSKGGAAATELVQLPPVEGLCRNMFTPLDTPSFRNQRDVSMKLSVGDSLTNKQQNDGSSSSCSSSAAPLMMIVVPSTHDPSTHAPTVMSFVSSTGTTKVVPLGRHKDGTTSSSYSLDLGKKLGAASANVDLVCSISAPPSGHLESCSSPQYCLWVLLSQPSMQQQKSDPLGPLYLTAKIGSGATTSPAAIQGGGWAAVNYADLSAVSNPFSLTGAEAATSRNVNIRVSCARQLRALTDGEKVLVTCVLQAIPSGSATSTEGLSMPTLALAEVECAPSPPQPRAAAAMSQPSPHPPSKGGPGKARIVASKPSRSVPLPRNELLKAGKATNSVAALYGNLE